MTEQRFTTTMGSFRKIRGPVQPAVTVGDSSGRSARISLTNIARRRHAHSQTSVFGELGRVERESTLLHPLHKLAAKRAIGTKPYSRRFRGTPGRFRCTCTSHGVASKTAHVSRQIPACYPGAANKIRRQWLRFAKILTPCVLAAIHGRRTTDIGQRTTDHGQGTNRQIPNYALDPRSCDVFSHFFDPIRWE